MRRSRTVVAVGIAAALLAGVTLTAILRSSWYRTRTVSQLSVSTIDLPAADSLLPPGYVAPPSLAALQPGAVDAVPSRRDPIGSWLEELTRPVSWWFVRRNPAGTPTGGLRLEVIRSAGAWACSFEDGDRVAVDGVTARLAPRSKATKVGWRVGMHVVAVTAIGDTSMDDLLAYATTVVAGADIDVAAPPDGFTSVAVPKEIGTVDYERPSITIATFLPTGASGGARIDLGTIAFMTPERIGDPLALPASGGYLVSLVSGPQVAIIELADGSIAALTTAAKNDPAALAGRIASTPTETIPTRQLIPGLPPGTPMRFGETSHGRWAFAAFVDDDGLSCRFLAGPAPGASQGCGGHRSTACPLVERRVGIAAERELTVILPSLTDDLSARADGREVSATTEQSAGFTFLFGAVPPGIDKIDVLVNGAVVCRD